MALALFAPLSALTSGCYKTVTLRPDQIPRLSGMARPQALSAGRDSTVLLEDRTTIITADGTTDEVRGQAELTLTLVVLLLSLTVATVGIALLAMAFTN